LGRSDLSVSILVSPDAREGLSIVRKAKEAFVDADGAPPTLCILQQSWSDQDMLVLDHISYRSDFRPYAAMAFIGELDGKLAKTSFPSSQETAELMEGLSGTCRF